MPDADIQSPGQDVLQWLAGREPTETRPLHPFAAEAVSFLAALSSELQSEPRARSLSDVQTFAFWCRRRNLVRLQRANADGRHRLGRGLLLHIAPSNVPVTFAYSFAFGLLAGNAGIIRAPSRNFEQVDLISEAVGRLLARPEHALIAGMIGLVRYPQASDWTRVFSERCDGRILWGGDDTIAAIRRLPMPARAIDVTFADRTSLSVLRAQAVAELDDAALLRLAEDFYNDTYRMDQNACSSPHVIVWLGEGDATERAARRFWQALDEQAARHYPLAPVQAVDKYTNLLSFLIGDDDVMHVRRYGNRLIVVGLPRLPEGVDRLRGQFGLFWELSAFDLTVLSGVSSRLQTLTIFGLDTAAIANFVVEQRLRGIDRIVPVGRALDLGLVWDGHDLVGLLSRIVSHE